MDNLTAKKKSELITACIASQNTIAFTHFDIRKMYAFLAEEATKSETSNDIAMLNITKTALDFLVKGVLK